MEELQGKVAVVTGAASGIGLAMATRFAAEGMKVLMADIEAGALDDAAAREGSVDHGAGAPAGAADVRPTGVSGI